MANKKISELDVRSTLGLSDLLVVGDPSTGYAYKTTINDLKTITGAGVISFNGRVGAVVPVEGDYSFGQLSDVIITTATSGQYSRYNGTNWVNSAIQAGDIPDIGATYVTLATTQTISGEKTFTNNVRIDSGSSTKRLILDADNNVPRIFSFRTDDTQRWAIRVDGDETGSNAGADFSIRRYNDAGTFVDAPIQITRSNGAIRINHDITMYDDGVNNGDSRKIYFRALGDTGQVQTAYIALDGYDGTNGEYLQLSSSNIRLSPTTGNVSIVGTNPTVSTTSANGIRLLAYSTTNGIKLVQGYNQTSGDLLSVFNNSNQKKFSIAASDSSVTVSSLSGTGSRMVVADANGVLSTVANPVTGSGTAQYLAKFTSTGSVIGDSSMYYESGANYNAYTFGSIGAGNVYNTSQLNIYSNNQSEIYLQFGSNKYAHIGDNYGDFDITCANTGVHSTNTILYYKGSSADNRYVSIGTEGTERLFVKQTGQVTIGTSTFHSNFSANLVVANTSGNANFELRAGTSEQAAIHLTMGTSDSSTSPRAEIFNSSNFGIVFYRPGILSSNYLMYYDSDSATNRSLSFQTEGQDRLTINQDGSSTFSGAINGTSAVFSSTVQASAIKLTNMAAGSGALYYNTTESRLTLANYNANGILMFEVNGGSYAMSLNANLSATFYGGATFSGNISSPRLTATSTGGNGLRVYGGSGTNQWDIYLNGANLRFSDNTGTGSFVVDRPSTFSDSITVSGNNSIFTGGTQGNLNTYPLAIANNKNLVFGSPAAAQPSRMWSGGIGSDASENINIYAYNNFTIGTGTSLTNALTISSTGAAIFGSTVGVGNVGAQYATFQSSSPTFGSTVGLISLAIVDGTYNPRSTISYKTQTGSAYSVRFSSGYSSGWAATNWVYESGLLGIGTDNFNSSSRLTVEQDAANIVTIRRGGAGSNTAAGRILFQAANANSAIENTAIIEAGLESSLTASYLDFRSGSGSSHLRIDSSGRVLIGTTNSNPAENNVKGVAFYQDGRQFISSDNNEVMRINRKTSDGVLVYFHQDGTAEGNISVSGTTVSYNGGHLARYSQTESNERIEGLLKGTVMSNIDKMAEWINPETGEPYANEQLNCMKISDVEGDVNVAGVFVNWDDDDKTFTNDMNIAMTGDMIIRIAKGVVVEKGQLLISAGDGTAKPQTDDLIRSNTIAKVTSNHVTCVYEDESYCVPCVLMAC